MNNLRIKPCVIAVSLIILCFAGCPADSDGDMSIGEITIYNIPADIPVMGKADVSHPTYKIYLNASDTQDDDKPPKAQAMALVSPAMLAADGTYSVTLQLRKPKINLKNRPDGSPSPYNPPGWIYDPDLDPNLDDGPWSGTANFFSVMIFPEYKTADGDNVLWPRGNANGLNKGRKRCNWESLLDFRGEFREGMELDKKTKALYEDLICRDPQIKEN